MPLIKYRYLLVIYFFILHHLSECQVTLNTFQKISDLEGNFEGNLKLGDQFGSDIAVIGDLNNDGIVDIVVGANDDGGLNKGAIYILFLNNDNTVKDFQKISAMQGNFTGNLNTNDKFGIAVESIGDLDGDGIPDIAVGANYDSEAGYQTGAVWILFLNSDGTVKSHQKINSIHGNFNRTFPELSSFGSSIASLGDLNNDGIPDIAVGAYRDHSNTNKSGTFYILFMNADGTVKSSQKIGEGLGGFNDTLQGDGYFGGQIVTIGDLDGDGVVDIAVSGFRDGASKGAVWILFLNANGTVKKSQKITTGVGNFKGVLQNGDFFGSALAAIDDLDGDEILDIAVGADKDQEGGPNKGAVWLLYLNRDGTVKGFQKFDDSSKCFEGVLNEGDYFGGSLDFINDPLSGKQSLVSAAVLDDDGGENKGAIYFLNFEKIVWPLAGGDQIVCNDKTYLSGNVPGNDIQGLWSVVSGSGIVIEANNPRSEVQNLSLGENKFVWTFFENQCEFSYSDTVIVRYLNTAELFEPDAGEDQMVCENYAELTGNAPVPGLTGEWIVVSGSGTIMEPNNPRSAVEDLSLGENRFVWTFLGMQCFGNNSDTVVIKLLDNVLPLDPYAGEDRIVCQSNTSLSANSPPDGIMGQWSFISGSGQVQDVNNPNSVVQDLSPGENVFIWSFHQTYCDIIKSDTIKIFFASLKEHSFNEVIQRVCNGKTTLTVDLPEEVSGKWEIVSGFGIIENSEKHTTDVKDLSLGENVFKFSPQDKTCEAFTQTITVIHEKLRPESFPNVITPNDDGKNDYLEFIDLVHFPSNELLIINRWGMKVYEKVGYQNDWDGEGLGPGLYYIRLRVDECIDYKGWVQIMN